MTTAVDYLDEDTFLPKLQKFVCLSFLKSEDNKVTLSGIKIRGVFEKYEDACVYAKKVQEIDKYFNVFVGEMGKWLPFDPNPSKVENAEYTNDQLNNIMKEYKLNQEKAKIYYEKQKNEKMVKSLTESLSINEKNKKKLEKKTSKLTGKSKKRTLTEIKNIEERMKEIKDKANALKDKYTNV
jgi:hypothetical protein